MKVETFVRDNYMGFQHTHRVTVSKDRGEIVGLVNVVHQHSEVWLTLGEHGPQAVKTFWPHKLLY
tara:strand:- start:17 stop:211 length:195 start_codon:yes stop_codon:yes gene_type:complete